MLAAQRKDLASAAAVMFAFGVGTTLPMLAVAVLSRTALPRWRQRMPTPVRIIAPTAMALRPMATLPRCPAESDRRVETI